jgi:hypothetical protein
MRPRDHLISLAELDAKPPVRNNVIQNKNLTGELLEEYNSHWSIDKCEDVLNWSNEDFADYNNFLDKCK